MEEMCSAAGFEIIKSVDVKMEDLEFENVESLCSFILATHQGRFVSELATRDKVSRFCTQYTSGENSKPLTVYTDERRLLLRTDCSQTIKKVSAFWIIVEITIRKGYLSFQVSVQSGIYRF